MYFQTSVGINIESNRVSLICLKRSLQGLSLAGQAIYALEKETPAEKASEISLLVNDFLSTRGILSADIFLGIQRDWTILRYIELPLAVKENLRGTLMYEMEKYVPLAAGDIYFDFQIISEDKAAGRVTVLLIAVKKEWIDPYLEGENRLGAGISGIEINSTALVNRLSCQPGAPDADTFAFLSLTDEHLELGLVRRGLLTYSRHVKTDKKGDDNRQRLVDDELALLRKTLGTDPDRLEVVFCGSDGSIAEALKERADIHPVPLELSGTGLSSELLTTAYGLALKGIRKTPMDINLLPLSLRKKVSKTAYYTMVVLIGFLMITILGWAGSNLLHQRRLAGRLESEIKRLGAEVETIHQARAQVKELEGQLEALNTLRQNHLPALDILRELSGSIPRDAWFSKFAITDKKGDVEGYADSASALIPLLAASPLLQDVAFLSPITKDKDGKEKFRIGFNIR